MRMRGVQGHKGSRGDRSARTQGRRAQGCAG